MWGSACDTLLSPLELLQKRCLRIITKSTFLAHTEPLFKRCRILKLKDLFKYRLAVYAFGIKNDLAVHYARSHSYHTRFTNDLLPEFQRLQVCKQSLNYKVPMLWNSIPAVIKNSRSMSIFKKSYKNYILDT